MPKPEAVSRTCRHVSVEGPAVYKCWKFHEPSLYFGRDIREKRNPVLAYWWNVWSKIGPKTSHTRQAKVPRWSRGKLLYNVVPIGNGHLGIKWSRDRWRHVTLKCQGLDPNAPRGQYLENGWRYRLCSKR